MVANSFHWHRHVRRGRPVLGTRTTHTTDSHISFPLNNVDIGLRASTSIELRAWVHREKSSVVVAVFHDGNFHAST
jgi:ABC-type enterochelin transport system ATPase subunit